jgi:Mg-chelatase subunit ChlD
MKMTVKSERRLARAAGDSVRYAHALLTAPEAPRRHGRQAVNVALVLDRSGSMGGEKIKLARQAVERALQMLHPDDRFALVVYDTVVDVLMESTPCTQDARREALRRLAEIDARGGTDLSSGWLSGCEQVARFLDSGALGRCLLVTDGLANHGIKDHDTLVQHAHELRQRGIVTSTFGVGADFDERLLQRMADAGAGHFYFIERAVQITDLLTSELGEALEVVSRAVTVAAEAPAGVRVELLNPWPTQATRDGVVVTLGDLASAQEISLVFKVTLPAGAEGSAITTAFRVSDQDGPIAAASAVQEWLFASHVANDGQPRDLAVDEIVANIYAARARGLALEANRRGDYETARAVIEATVRKILSYAGDRASLHTIAAGLQAEVQRVREQMSALSMKAMHRDSYSPLRSRDAEGRSRRTAEREAASRPK